MQHTGSHEPSPENWLLRKKLVNTVPRGPKRGEEKQDVIHSPWLPASISHAKKDKRCVAAPLFLRQVCHPVALEKITLKKEACLAFQPNRVEDPQCEISGLLCYLCYYLYFYWFVLEALNQVRSREPNSLVQKKMSVFALMNIDVYVYEW